MSIEAMKQALEALDELFNTKSYWWQEVDDGTHLKLDAAKKDLRQAIEQAEQPAQHDIPDLIAGALGVSRGTAYDLMREALAEQAQPVAALESVLCDPSGKCCIAGSEKDRAIVDAALAALKQNTTPPPRQPLTDAVTKELWHKSRLMTASQTRWQVFKKLIEAAHGITKENT
jgi:hypothetical protein